MRIHVWLLLPCSMVEKINKRNDNNQHRNHCSNIMPKIKTKEYKEMGK